jgi:hypothetical protein
MIDTTAQSTRGRIALLIVGIVAALWSLGSATFGIPLHGSALIVIALANLILAAAAYVLARGLLRGLPFSRLMSRQLFASAVGLLVIAIVGQLLTWWGAILAIASSPNLAYLSPQPPIDPLMITIALALILIAGAFRYGERLQRETEGLV